MSNLNLFDTYDKSLADINKDYLDGLIISPDKKTQLSKNKPSTIVVSIILMILSSVGSIYYLLSNQIIPLRDIEKTAVDSRDYDEKRGFVRVQLFEFTDNDTLAVVENIHLQDNRSETLLAGAPESSKLADVIDSTPQRDTAYKQSKGRVSALPDEFEGIIPTNLENITTQPLLAGKDNKISNYKKANEQELLDQAMAQENLLINQARARREAQHQAELLKRAESFTRPILYSILFEDISKTQFNRVNNILTSKNIIPEDITEVISTPIWRVYVFDNEDGDVIINSDNYRKLGEFNTELDAKVFFTKVVEQTEVIIKKEFVLSKEYNILACCTDLELAKTIATQTSITDKVVKIIRNK